MSPDSNGGTAFPFPTTDCYGATAVSGPWAASPGMTLRDYFAAAALTGLLADSNVVAPWKSVAETSYKCADAMLAARTEASK